MLKTRAARPLVLLFLASRGWLGQAVFLVTVLVVAVLAVPDLEGVPFVSDRSVFRLVWVSCVPGVVVAGFLAPPGDVERSFPIRPAGIVRLAWVLSLALLPGCMHALTQLLIGTYDPLISAWFLRNHVLMLAIGLITSTRVTPSATWLPGCLYLLLCWFLGAKDSVGASWWWALPNHLPEDPWAGVIAAVAISYGAVLHYLGPARS
jgi:hypothetical protein